jgi:hypothetical protein
MMIDLETRLLEILEWDEEKMEEIFLTSANLINESRFFDISSLRKLLNDHLIPDIGEEAAALVFGIMDQNIRKQMRIIEE